MYHESGPELITSLIRGNIQLTTLRDTLIDSPVSDLEYTIREREVALDKEMLQLVQAACKADNLQRALDITRLMYNTGTIEAAAKVAAFYHLPGLQERIHAVKAEKESKKTTTDRAYRRSHNGAGDSAAATPKGFTDFAPRNGVPRRSFAGVTVNRESTPVGSTAPAASGRSETHVPETPREEIEMTPLARNTSPSPESKRKRMEHEVELDDFVPLKKRVDDSMTSGYKSFLVFYLETGGELTIYLEAGPKNPFAKKAQPPNPFAKSAPPPERALSSIKSTSFFERVDNIESGVAKGGYYPHE